MVIASKGGASTNPNWCYNLVASPDTKGEVGTETFQVHAEVTEEPARTCLYNKMVEMMPGFDEYRYKTMRTIPLFVQTPKK